MQTMCRTRADSADLVQTLQTLCRHFFKSLRLADYADFCKVCTSAKIWHAALIPLGAKSATLESCSLLNVCICSAKSLQIQNKCA